MTSSKSRGIANKRDVRTSGISFASFIFLYLATSFKTRSPRSSSPLLRDTRRFCTRTKVGFSTRTRSASSNGEITSTSFVEKMAKAVCALHDWVSWPGTPVQLSNSASSFQNAASRTVLDGTKSSREALRAVEVFQGNSILISHSRPSCQSFNLRGTRPSNPFEATADAH